ncbi:MAG: hypothetical protein IIC72_07575 [Acidobacteria bacterium]|nr:hypothetical protein [Acidobacteriota bacterium]
MRGEVHVGLRLDELDLGGGSMAIRRSQFQTLGSDTGDEGASRRDLQEIGTGAESRLRGEASWRIRRRVRARGR